MVQLGFVLFWVFFGGGVGGWLGFFAKVVCIFYVVLLATVACFQRIETNFNISRNKIELGKRIRAKNTNNVYLTEDKGLVAC